MISIRQSHLEQFRRVLMTDYAEEQELIDQVKGQGKPNWMMQAGTRWHELLAGQGCNVERYGRDHATEAATPFKFDGEAVLAARKFIGPGLHEVPAWRQLAASVQGNTVVTITGTCDHIRGRIVSDNKTKFSTPDARDYEQSLQWRVYLLLHDADIFQYNFWHFKDPDDSGYCAFKDLTTFRFFRYPEMEQDVRQWVSRFVAWLQDRNLAHYLERSS